jgi:hypothetical protein
MNEYIRPFFETVLPRLQSEKIRYWIYGGIGYAAMVGRYYRKEPNSDVDLFVLDSDFTHVEMILQKICEESNWKICKEFLRSRPKIEILLKNNKYWKERLSVVPAYPKNDRVELKFREGSGEYLPNILDQKERSLEGFTFFTLSDEFLKKLFLEYLGSKKRYPPKRVEDARYILTRQEFEKYFPNETYDQKD